MLRLGLYFLFLNAGLGAGVASASSPIGSGSSDSASSEGATHSWGGRSMLNTYLPTTRTLSKLPNQSTAELWLNLKTDYNEKHRTHFEFSQRVDAHNLFYPINGGVGKDTVAFNAREAYYRYSSDGLRITAGQQIFAWGKADGINPTDFLSAQLQTRLYSDPNVKRLGAPALTIDWTPENGESAWNGTFVFQAYHPQSTLAIPMNQVQANQQIDQSLNEQRQIGRDSELAAKISYTGEDWDADFISFYGFNHNPYLQLKSISPSFNLSFQTRTERILGIGSNWSRSMGAYTARVEVAHTQKITVSEYDGSLSRQQVQAVVGIERKIGLNYRAQVSLIVRDNQGWTNRMAAANGSPTGVQLAQLNNALYELNRVLQGENVKTRVGEMVRLSYAPEEESKWSAEALFIYYGYMENSNLFQPKVGYEFVDNLKGSVGAFIVDGRTGEPLGFAHSLSSYFMELSYVF